jgi:hypothetical protein
MENGCGQFAPGADAPIARRQDHTAAVQPRQVADVAESNLCLPTLRSLPLRFSHELIL